MVKYYRLLTSVYEAITIHYQLKCTAENKDFLPLWFLYAIAAMNAMLVILLLVIPAPFL